jgi:DNA polymerase-3 subunit alpha
MNEGLQKILGQSEGKDNVVIVLKDTRQMKKLPPNHNIEADAKLIGQLMALLGEENVKLV